MQFNMHESKSWLSVLTEKVLARKKAIITRTGKPFLRLIYYKHHTSPILPGGGMRARLKWLTNLTRLRCN